ncbi:hypothetical protein C8J56DRAFT_1054578 [Mycena floridula]|nr:hypothetical protein C8J56DRAFT_1054578 [Mycena floridula]
MNQNQTTSDAIQPFPELPFEIVCLILEKVIEMEPRGAVKLLCLSRDFRSTVERALHRCIVLKSSSAADSFLNTLKSHPDIFQNHVQVLCTTTALPTSKLHSIFSACPGLQKIAIFRWEGLEPDVALDDLSSSGPRPSKLSCDFRWTRRIDGSDRFSLPLFENVTHLELDVDEVHDFDGRRLHCLTQLTYLSICDTYTRFHGSEIIQKLHLADSISVCILYSASYLFLSQDTINDMVPDLRVVIARDPHRRGDNDGNSLRRALVQPSHYLRQWGPPRLNKAELDMWEEAEEIVKVRRAKLTAAK